MRSAFLTALALLMVLALPARALDLKNLTDSERQVLRGEIRAYLLDNPQVIMDAVAVLRERDAAAQAESDTRLIAENSAAIFEDGDSWAGGNLAGDVTVVEFMDYRCGYCRRAAPDVEALIKDDGNLRFVVKEFPILGEQSLLSSRFAIATRLVAGDAAYKSVHDALLALKGAATEAALRRIGATLGLDTPAIMDRMDSPEVNRVIADTRQLGRKLNLNGTPAFVIGDRVLRGYMPRAEMENLVAEIRNDG